MICETLQKHEIPLSECRGQGYDNGSNMSGKNKGAQARILQKNKLAIYCPCAVQKLCNVCSGIPQRWKILLKHINCYLHGTSETRWSARVEAAKPFAGHIPGLRAVIEEIKTLNLTVE